MAVLYSRKTGHGKPSRIPRVCCFNVRTIRRPKCKITLTQFPIGGEEYDHFLYTYHLSWWTGTGLSPGNQSCTFIGQSKVIIGVEKQLGNTLLAWNLLNISLSELGWIAWLALCFSESKPIKTYWASSMKSNQWADGWNKLLRRIIHAIFKQLTFVYPLQCLHHTVPRHNLSVHTPMLFN